MQNVVFHRTTPNGACSHASCLQGPENNWLHSGECSPKHGPQNAQREHVGYVESGGDQIVGNTMQPPRPILETWGHGASLMSPEMGPCRLGKRTP